MPERVGDGQLARRMGETADAIAIDAFWRAASIACADTTRDDDGDKRAPSCDLTIDSQQRQQTLCRTPKRPDDDDDDDPRDRAGYTRADVDAVVGWLRGPAAEKARIDRFDRVDVCCGRRILARIVRRRTRVGLCVTIDLNDLFRSIERSISDDARLSLWCNVVGAVIGLAVVAFILAPCTLF